MNGFVFSVRLFFRAGCRWELLVINRAQFTCPFPIIIIDVVLYGSKIGSAAFSLCFSQQNAKKSRYILNSRIDTTNCINWNFKQNISTCQRGKTHSKVDALERGALSNTSNPWDFPHCTEVLNLICCFPKRQNNFHRFMVVQSIWNEAVEYRQHTRCAWAHTAICF